MKLVSISSGKGGVGKTTVTCNLALSLAEQNKKVLILDGDLGMANVDIFFGVRAFKTSYDVLKGSSLKECLTPVLHNIDLLAGGSGLFELTQINAFQRRELIQQIQELQFEYDFVLIDTAPGVHEFVLHLNAVADDCIVLLTQEPASFADAYALIKVLHQKYKISEFKILCNMIDEKNGQSLFVRFSDVVEKFLRVRLQYLMSLPQDGVLAKTQVQQRLITRQSLPNTSCKVFRQLAEDLISESTTTQGIQPSKGLEGIFRPVTGHA